MIRFRPVCRASIFSSRFNICLKDDDEARSCIVRAAELGVINSCDILPVYREYKQPSHEEFAEPTRWSLMNAISEVVML